MIMTIINLQHICYNRYMLHTRTFSDKVSSTFVRSLDFTDLLQNFLISTIVAILGIRIFLQLTGFPQLGGGGLHIAHMLWGGALMLTAIILLLTFLGRSVKHLASVLAGLGFGTFIDELGKFITSDNNYFYQPTFSLIYVILILLYLLFYSLRKSKLFSDKEYLINSFEYLKEAVIQDLDIEEKKLALHYLSRADKGNSITETMEKLFQKLDAIAVRKPSLYATMKINLGKQYYQAVEKKWFLWMINALFIIQALVSAIVILTSGVLLVAIVADLKIDLGELTTNNVQLFELFANAISGVFVILGVSKIWKSRLRAYLHFKKAILVSLFLIQPFSFYQNQLGAFYGVLFDLILLTTINYLIEKEVELKHSTE